MFELENIKNDYFWDKYHVFLTGNCRTEIKFDPVSNEIGSIEQYGVSHWKDSVSALKVNQQNRKNTQIKQ